MEYEHCGEERVRIFSTCPPLGKQSGREYIQEVKQVAQWSDEARCVGILVYTDNRQVDPWLVSNVILGCTVQLAPLVAVQPIYMHPFTAAKMVASLSYMHGRYLYLNMVAGGFTNDLIALNDDAPHDTRYTRLVEYTKVVQLLFQGGPVQFTGTYYTLNAARLRPAVEGLRPSFMVSGSSPAGLAAARETGAIAVQYPKPAGSYGMLLEGGLTYGIRIGVIARESEEEAWSVALERFPEDRRGQLAHQLAMKVSDSAWHAQLSAMSPGAEAERHPYWMVPFNTYKTFCPYLVGSYERVAHELARYLWLGYSTFILDIPRDPDDFHHANVAFDLAKRRLSDARTASTTAIPASRSLSANGGRRLSGSADDLRRAG